ncbi:MAG: hypothetical protein Sv326_1191 [Candidatus Fermentimicrarchaeum limneticum]|uniref:Uncharacterized protein n=1 Tax=Fermentimicrarchaeum limneticum TaxID=2795018 RepID=A0A7D5XM64_FERL1|nr:MAG: hypothetical protein Sv326_1191 [Candidatus Fermentimicrarchaeum limneticum]
MRKAQAAIELTIIASVMLIVLLFIFEFGETKILESASILQVSEARNTVDRLAKAATEVHNEGVGAKRKVYITIPDRVNPDRVFVDNSTITIGVYVGNGTSDISSRVNLAVKKGGYFPTSPGSYWVWVAGKEGYVQIGNALEINPLNAYFELFPNNSTESNITFTNYGSSPINVSMNLSWTDSETNASIDNTRNLSFALLPGTLNSQSVRLNVSANLNASKGLHSGYATVTTNISESELMPVLVNVVSPTSASGGVAYLTINTYNNSAHTYSDTVFSQSETVYYKVRSYNSSDGLVNSTVTIRVYNPSSAIMSDGTYTPSSTGTYQSSYPLNINTRSGVWSISAYDAGGASTRAYFTVNPTSSSTVLLSVTTATPFWPSQRAICRDGKNYIHIIWLYNSSSIAYARSTNNGVTFSINTSFFGSTSTTSSTKYTPSVSCDGNNITAVYTDAGSSDVIVGISTDNGNSWNWANPITSNIRMYNAVERRGQRIYILYVDGEYNVSFFNSTDGGSTWGPQTILWQAGDYGQFGYDHYTDVSLAVNGTGTSSDSLYASCYEIASDGTSQTFASSFRNSSNAGVTWGAKRTMAPWNDVGTGEPSITTNGSAVFVASNNYSSTEQVATLNKSLDGGATWSWEQVSNTVSSFYETATLNGTMPFILWRNGSASNGDIFYRNYNGTGWDSILAYTSDHNGNDLPNAKWNYAGNCIEFVYRNGTASPYNISYARLGSCTPP